MHLAKQCADQVTAYVEHCRWTAYQHVSGRLHVAIRGGFEGDITAELARVQALQEEALLLQHWTAIHLLQPLQLSQCLSCKALGDAVGDVVYESYFGVKAVMRCVWKRLLGSEVVWHKYDQPATLSSFQVKSLNHTGTAKQTASQADACL